MPVVLYTRTYSTPHSAATTAFRWSNVYDRRDTVASVHEDVRTALVSSGALDPTRQHLAIYVGDQRLCPSTHAALLDVLPCPRKSRAAVVVRIEDGTVAQHVGVTSLAFAACLWARNDCAESKMGGAGFGPWTRTINVNRVQAIRCIYDAIRKECDAAFATVGYKRWAYGRTVCMVVDMLKEWTALVPGDAKFAARVATWDAKLKQEFPCHVRCERLDRVLDTARAQIQGILAQQNRS